MARNLVFVTIEVIINCCFVDIVILHTNASIVKKEVIFVNLCSRLLSEINYNLLNNL